MHRLRSLLMIVIFSCSSMISLAENVSLAPDHPQRYTVVKGDTLWDIAARFLNRPWDWPKIWKVNPQIRDPHWIYPGDVIVLEYVNGQPTLTLERGRHGSETERLRPRVRSTPIAEAIPTIPYDAVRQFLTSPKVVTKQEIQSAPYIVSLADNRLIGGSGDTIYVRGLEEAANGATVSGYTVFRRDDVLKNPETEEELGYNALYVADTHLQRGGDPATLIIDRSVREVIVGDRLLPVIEEQLALDYHPKPAPQSVRGHIIKVLDGVSQIGQYDLVVIDQGLRDGLEKGHVLRVWRHGQKMRDWVKEGASRWITLPDEKAGLVMIFRPFERVSYGIVMKASLAIHLGDLVTAPEL